MEVLMKQHTFSQLSKSSYLCSVVIAFTVVICQTAAAQTVPPTRVPSAMSPESTISVQTKQNTVLPSKKYKLSWNLSDTIYELPEVELAQIAAKAANQIGVNRDVHVSMK